MRDLVTALRALAVAAAAACGACDAFAEPSSESGVETPVPTAGGIGGHRAPSPAAMMPPTPQCPVVAPTPGSPCFFGLTCPIDENCDGSMATVVCSQGVWQRQPVTSPDCAVQMVDAGPDHDAAPDVDAGSDEDAGVL